MSLRRRRLERAPASFVNVPVPEPDVLAPQAPEACASTRASARVARFRSAEALASALVPRGARPERAPARGSLPSGQRSSVVNLRRRGSSTRSVGAN
jgi:hypothetical protein